MPNKDIKTLEDIKSEADPDIEVLSLRKLVSNLRSEIKSIQTQYGDLKAYFSDVADAASHMIVPKLETLYKSPKGGTRVESPCAAIVHLTDWHGGARQEPDEIEYIDEFSWDILQRRIKNFCSDYLKFMDVMRFGYKIDNLHVFVTGDMISGDIHKELQITNEWPAPVQAVRVGQFLGSTICQLSRYFVNTTVEFVVPDNHSRLTLRPQAKQEGLNSHNYTVGHIAKLVCSNQENVTFNIYTSYTKSVRVINRNYLLTHGHGVRGWAGFPYYGLERFVSREAMVRLHEPDYNKFHRCIMGHFHAPLTHPWYWIGGSASGTDAYDHKNGRKAKPMQCFWFVHPKHGDFNRNEFVLRSD